MPIGRTGRLEAHPLTAGEDAAVLVREAGGEARPKALLTADKHPEGERLVVTPLDDDVDVRVDGDALAVWIGTAWTDDGTDVRPREPATPTSVPVWATVVGAGLLVLILALTAIGSAVAFSWLVGAFT